MFNVSLTYAAEKSELLAFDGQSRSVEGVARALHKESISQVTYEIKSLDYGEAAMLKPFPYKRRPLC